MNLNGCFGVNTNSPATVKVVTGDNYVYTSNMLKCQFRYNPRSYTTILDSTLQPVATQRASDRKKIHNSNHLILLAERKQIQKQVIRKDVLIGFG